MSRVCVVCQKGQSAGNNVSHSNRKTRRTFKANVQKVKIVKDGKVESELFARLRFSESGLFSVFAKTRGFPFGSPLVLLAHKDS